MSAYAVAVIQETRFGPEIKEYLEKIDATLFPYSGKFRVHGGPYETLEGSCPADLVIIEFPTMSQAKQWYESAAYQAIKPFRANNTEGALFLVEGAPDDHKATDILG